MFSSSNVVAAPPAVMVEYDRLGVAKVIKAAGRANANNNSGRTAFQKLVGRNILIWGFVTWEYYCILVRVSGSTVYNEYRLFWSQQMLRNVGEGRWKTRGLSSCRKNLSRLRKDAAFSDLSAGARDER